MLKVHRPVAWKYPISSKYGFRVDPITKTQGTFHYGTDFAVPEGTPIVAVLDGKIYKAGWQDEKDKEKGYGLRVWQLATSEDKKLSVFYGHLSEISVNDGQEITAGTRIGLSGNSGKSSGPHLHLEIRPEGKKGIEVEFI